MPWHRTLRNLWRSPIYVCGVVLSLAAGLGVNATAVSLAARAIRQPLGFDGENDLVSLGKAIRHKEGGVEDTHSWELAGEDLRRWRAETEGVAGLAMYSAEQQVVAGSGAAEMASGAAATANLLTVLGVRPALGRWFTEDEKNASVVVLSYDLWRRQFGQDPGVLGRVLRIRGQPLIVIGVLSPNGALPLDAQYWVPSDEASGEIVGRMMPGARRGTLATSLTRQSSGVAHLRDSGYDARIVVQPLRQRLFGVTKPALILLIGAAAMLLVLACANVANLALARALRRQPEFAVRIALGARRRTLAGLLLREHVVLGVAGAMVAVILGVWATDLVATLAPPELRMATPNASSHLALFASIGIGAVGTALLMTVAPSMALGEYRSLTATLERPDAHTVRRFAHRGRRALVVLQLAIGIVLLTGAGMLLATVKRAHDKAHLGFRTSGVIVATVRLFGEKYRNAERRNAFVNDVISRLSMIPGTEAVATGPPPLVGGRGEHVREGFTSTFAFQPKGHAPLGPVTVWTKHVDHHFRSIYDIVLLAGRDFNEGDVADGQPVALLNRTAARLFFGHSDAVGQVLPVPNLSSRAGAPYKVIGVLQDALQNDVALRARPEVLLLSAQQPSVSPLPTFNVRSTSPHATVRLLGEIIRDVDPELAAMRLQTMDEIVAASVARHRFLLMLVGLFSVLALVVAVIGLYAVVSYFATQRAGEIAVRIALGARQAQVAGMVLREALMLAAMGVGIGVVGSVMLRETIETWVIDFHMQDAVVVAAGPLVLVIVAVLASVLPARHAARVNPIQLLRHE